MDTGIASFGSGALCGAAGVESDHEGAAEIKHYELLLFLEGGGGRGWLVGKMALVYFCFSLF